jgi:phosphoglycerol geranylgeranyltransferase
MNLNGAIYAQMISKMESKTPQTAVLIDPDKNQGKNLELFVKKIEKTSTDYIFVGGSLIFYDIDKCISIIKDNTSKPVIIFPGSHTHISEKADAILLLSLISGRNPEYLIGNHVIAAPRLYESSLEIISTAYILINGGSCTSVEYISNTKSIPSDKHDIALATAIAGEMTGNKLIYLETGSGAASMVPSETIKQVSNHCNIPIIVGGGIKSADNLQQVFNSGASIAVIGTALENNPNLIGHIQR